MIIEQMLGFHVEREEGNMPDYVSVSLSTSLPAQRRS